MQQNLLLKITKCKEYQTSPVQCIEQGRLVAAAPNTELHRENN